jgi:chorismate mutase
MIRGVRGATTVTDDDADAIIAATQALLAQMIERNNIAEHEVASVFFTTTPDLTAAYPARAARLLGWKHIALMGMQEMDNPAGLQRCIRVLIHWNTEKPLEDLVHVYMNGAEQLRPDFLYPKNKVVLNKERVER